MNVSTTSQHTHARSLRAGHRPGAMTARMRAVAVPSGPKVLRIGLVHRGQVVTDRMVRDRLSVTVGTSEAATFVVSGVGAPPRLTLFERAGDAYELRLIPGMSGRVADGDSVIDVAGLVAGDAGRGGVARLRLSDAARGRVTLGDATFLFQFVTPPLPAARPELPLSVKAGLASQVDWSLTIIAAFSFLLHFGVVGAMYSDWMDPIVDTQATVSGIVLRMQDLPELPVEIPTLPADDATASANTTPSAPPLATTPPRPVVPQERPRAMSPSEVARLSAAANDLGLVTLASLTTSGTAVEGALTASELPSVDLGVPGASDVGAAAATGNGLNFGHGAAAVVPGGQSSLGMLGHTSGDPNRHRAGVETQKDGPRSGVVTVEPLAGDTALPGAPQVVAGLRTGFRSCYNAGLNLDPSMSGKVVLSARVGPNGEVATATASNNVGLSDPVVQCLLKKLRTAQFEGGHPSTSVNVPVSFIQQAR